MLRRQGWRVNHKKAERIYAEEKLALRRRKRRKKFVGPRVPLPVATRPNQHLAMDFVGDRLTSGRKFWVLTMVDIFSRKNPALETDASLGGRRVVRVLVNNSGTDGLCPAKLFFTAATQVAGKSSPRDEGRALARAGKGG